MRVRIRTDLAVSAVVLLGLGLLGCAGEPAPSDKIPITTSSDQARELFLEGRDLQDKLRIPDAHEKFEAAVAQDSNFALAHLGMANTSPTNSEFFESLAKAKQVLQQVSEGEQHLIVAADAGASGDPEIQSEHLTALVEAFPQDERAHNAKGIYHLGRQEYDRAIYHYDKAIEINPEFSPPYNQKGYAHRSLEQYDEAEQAFRKYIELIPDDPNPYDSFAELLMKVGRFDESIQNYEQALERDPNFIASYVGIGNNQMFMGETEAARETFAKLRTVARTPAEIRQSWLWTAATYVHEGETEKALEAVAERYEVAEADDDRAAMAGDMVLAGNILLEAGSPDQAMDEYRGAVEMMETAEVPEVNKQNFKRNHLYREARVALAAGDLETAMAKTEAYGAEAAMHAIPFEMRLHHELLGMIALEQGDAEKALEHLAQANQQNPRILFLLAAAYDLGGDPERSREMCERAAKFNGLNLEYAYVRRPAMEMLEEMS